MKFNNRRDEALAKMAAQQEKAANEAQWKQQVEVMKTMKTPMLHPDHKLPTTRRELVSAGLMSGLAYAVVPGILTTISKRAYGIDAAGCVALMVVMDAAADLTLLLVTYTSNFLVVLSLAGNMVFGKQAAGAALELHAPEGYGTVGHGDGVIVLVRLH